jgi:hypothetical protein
MWIGGVLLTENKNVFRRSSNEKRGWGYITTSKIQERPLSYVCENYLMVRSQD